MGLVPQAQAPRSMLGNSMRVGKEGAARCFARAHLAPSGTSCRVAWLAANVSNHLREVHRAEPVSSSGMLPTALAWWRHRRTRLRGRWAASQASQFVGDRRSPRCRRPLTSKSPSEAFAQLRDIGDSVRARLLDLARTRHQAMDLLLTRYAIERFRRAWRGRKSQAENLSDDRQHATAACVRFCVAVPFTCWPELKPGQPAPKMTQHLGGLAGERDPR
jgi:hypothetical protein